MNDKEREDLLDLISILASAAGPIGTLVGSFIRIFSQLPEQTKEQLTTRITVAQNKLPEAK